MSSLVAVASSYFLGKILQWETSNTMLIVPVLVMASSALIYHKNRKEGNLFNNRLAYSIFNVGTTFGAFYAGTNSPALLNSPGVTEDPMIMNPFLGFLLFLLVLIALSAAFVAIAALSCSLSCGGMEVLAVVALFGGGFLVLFLGVLAAKNIFRKESQIDENLAGRAALTAIITMLVVGALFIAMIFI